MDTRIARPFCADGEIEILYRELNEFLQSNRKRVKSDLEQFKLEASRNHLVYGGCALSLTFYPFILTAAQARHISSVVEAVLRLVEKATTLFLAQPSVKEFFGFRQKQIELIEVDPGYPLSIPCARFDSIFDGRSLRFTELNTDGTSGMNGAEKVAKLFISAQSAREFFSTHPMQTFDINQRVLQALLECYAHFTGRKAPGPPRIAIVDWKEARTSEEFVAFAEFCRENGYEAIVADPRELEYDGRVLSHLGARIDIIYRRVVSSEYVSRLRDVKAMTRAFKDHNVCVVGSFRSDVGFSKTAFAVLHDPKFARFFTETEKKLAEAHVPWTRQFADAECEYRGRQANMVELARNGKDGFVLKPANLYEGRGVRLGIQTSRDEWEKLIPGALKNDYVLQELIPAATMDVGTWDDGIRMQRRFIHVGEYLFGGRFSGFYSRITETPAIGVESGEQLLPCLVSAR